MNKEKLTEKEKVEKCLKNLKRDGFTKIDTLTIYYATKIPVKRIREIMRELKNKGVKELK